MRRAGHGAVDERRTAAAELFVAARRGSGSGSGQEVELRLGAAQRAGSDDPLTHGQTAIACTGVHGTVHHARCLTSAESLTACHGGGFARQGGSGRAAYPSLPARPAWNGAAT